MNNYYGSSNSGELAWFFQRISGLFLVFLLLLHFFLIHFFNIDHTTNHISYTEVAKRLATPFWKTIDISFLILALFHAINGLKMIIDDYIHNSQIRILIFTGLTLLSLVLLALGLITIIPFRPVGQI